MNREVGERVAFTWNGNFLHGIIQYIEPDKMFGGNDVYIRDFQSFDPEIDLRIGTGALARRKEWQLMTIVE